MKKGIEGVIFDFNGVLWWDNELQKQAWGNFCVKFRGNSLTSEEYAHNIQGTPNKAGIEYILGHEILQTEADALTEEKESGYRELCLQQGTNFKLSPGAINFLDHLMTKNIPRTIATSSEVVNVKFFFQYLNLSTWFDFDTAVFDTGSYPGKPAPFIYLKAAEKLGLPPKDCMVIEDAKSGIAAAHAAGIGWIVALGSKEQHKKLSQLPGVNQTIEQLDELL